MRQLVWILVVFLSVGCSKHVDTDSYDLPEDPPVEDPDDGQDVGDDDDDQPVDTGPVNLDPNIRSLNLGSVEYSVLYTEDFFYQDQETGINPDIIIDTFNEDPRFTSGETIRLEAGETAVIFSDVYGDWPAIQVDFYD